MTAVPLSAAEDPLIHGGKATQLGAALRAALPVPDGFALGTGFVDAVAAGEAAALAELDAICARLPGEVAVRSSAVGEDSAEASFAGQHATILNAVGADAVREAVLAVWRSARTDAAQAYRARVGADMSIRMGVVIQRLVAADVAGVLFTCNPVTEAPELVIEAAWGLGEAVVQGMVIPDSYRLDHAGQLLESRPGYKEIKVQRMQGGGTSTEAVAEHLVEQACLDHGGLAALHALAGRCNTVFGAGPHDIEWAYEGDRLYLLQLRPVTNLP